jgi:HK97 family phage prohead protease
MIKRLEFKFSVKEVSEQGTFTGYASVFNNVDLGGDIVAPGAFLKTMNEKPNVPILFGHSTREVIGVNKEWKEDNHGLYVKGELNLDVQRARETHSLMKQGALSGLSIGYDPIQVDYSREKEGIRLLKEVKLYEYSVVAFPMNEAAQINDVKSLEDREELITRAIALAKGDEDLAKRIVSALAAEPAPAAKQEAIAPEIHAKANSILEMLRNGN